jgi:hypothetical protein
MESDDNPDLKSCRRPDSVEASPAGLRLKTLVANTCRTARWSTGHIGSKAKYGYGFFEARIKIADIKGVNNAFWLTTDDNFEIDVAEATHPSYIHIGLQYWPHNGVEKHGGMGWGASFVDNLAYGFHDIGLLRTPNDMVFAIDGEPVAAVVTHVKGPAAIRTFAAKGKLQNTRITQRSCQRRQCPPDCAIDAFGGSIAFEAVLPVAIENLVASLAGYAELPAHIGHGFPIQKPGDKGVLPSPELALHGIHTSRPKKRKV